MEELGSIGSEVLHAHEVHDIDIEAWYPARLRQEIHEAAYKRFGPSALLTFGFSMGDHYSQALIIDGMDEYRRMMADTSSQIQALHWFVKLFSQAYQQATQASQQCEGVMYGFYTNPIDELTFEFNAVSTLLAHHYTFSEGIIRGYLNRFISHQWDHTLTLLPEKTVTDELHSSFYWICQFKPKVNPLSSADLATSDYRQRIKGELFKKVLDESNTALALVMASVRYASMIQRSQLPSIASLSSFFKGLHVAWHPRDTIGGDFWWSFHHQENQTVTLALVDCAGHGVPGAMLSVLASSALAKIFAVQPNTPLPEALMQLDDAIRKSLRQQQNDSESDEGCDAALIRYQSQSQHLEFVGAKIGLFECTTKGEVIHHKADRISLGYRDPPSQTPQLHKWIAEEGSRFVCVTDGVTDQIGGVGPVPVAYGYKRLMKTIEQSRAFTAEQTTNHITDSVYRWQGAKLRRDDLTVMVFDV
jgi:serine phosphatase RsbU (regulator of sigma subunit)